MTAERIIKAGDRRPLLAGKSRDAIISTLPGHMEARRPYYDRAHLIISGDRLENKAQIAETVEDFVKNHLYNLEERE